MDVSTVMDLAQNEFQTWVQAQLTNNSMLIAGLGTVLLSGILYTLKSLPGKIWNAIYHRSTITVDIFSDNENFFEVVKELNKNTVNFLSRSNVLDKENMTVGMGGSWSKFRGKLVKISREKEKSDSKEFKQQLSLIFFLTSKKKVVKLFQDFFEEFNTVKRDKTGVYSLTKDWLQKLKDIPKRERESIFVSEEVLKHIETRIKFFLSNRKWYEERGIPYKYAILLHGVPGTGKTTLAKYIASFTDRDVVLISPSRLPSLVGVLNDDEPMYPTNGRKPVKPGYIGIMEDFDTDNVTEKRSTGLDDDDDDHGSTRFQITTLSDLLNAIDGINSPENFILVATTNHLSKLDPALFRKGRFDDVIEIMPLETSEILRMVKFFFGIDKLKNPAIEYTPIPGAEVQDIILQYFDDGPDRVIEVLNERFAV